MHAAAASPHNGRHGSRLQEPVLGIEHILTGFDHVLFVAALLLLVGVHSIGRIAAFWSIGRVAAVLTT